jgi:hypothetical protein
MGPSRDIFRHCQMFDGIESSETTEFLSQSDSSKTLEDEDKDEDSQHIDKSKKDDGSDYEADSGS